MGSIVISSILSTLHYTRISYHSIVEMDLRDTTKASHLYSSLKNVMDKCELSNSNMSAATTDGAPAMSGKRGRVRAMVEKDANECNNIDLIIFHCTLQQGNLCTKTFSGFQHVMSVVVNVVNFISSKGLYRKQFQHLLSELGSKYSDVSYYSELRWSSRGKKL
jgi:hypothetical protein